jgi:hypothetical protein
MIRFIICLGFRFGHNIKEDYPILPPDLSTANKETRFFPRLLFFKRRATPFQSAMSMLNLYINRVGKNLTEKEKEPLEQAKDELRKLCGKDTADN